MESWGKEVTGLSPGRLLKSSLSILGFCLARVKFLFEQFFKFYCDPWETFKHREEKTSLFTGTFLPPPHCLFIYEWPLQCCVKVLSSIVLSETIFINRFVLKQLPTGLLPGCQLKIGTLEHMQYASASGNGNLSRHTHSCSSPVSFSPPKGCLDDKL